MPVSVFAQALALVDEVCSPSSHRRWLLFAALLPAVPGQESVKGAMILMNAIAPAPECANCDAVAPCARNPLLSGLHEER